MIYPDIEPEDWAKRLNISIKKIMCIKCKKFFWCNIPIAMRDYRGFEARLHGCGKSYQTRIFTPTSDKAKAFWKTIFS